MDNRDFVVLDKILTERGVNNKYLLALSKEFTKMQTYLFENPDVQFYKSVRLMNKILSENKITDSRLRKKLEAHMDKINKIYCKYMTIELEMSLLKNDLQQLQENYENGDM